MPQSAFTPVPPLTEVRFPSGGLVSMAMRMVLRAGVGDEVALSGLSNRLATALMMVGVMPEAGVPERLERELLAARALGRYRDRKSEAERFGAMALVKTPRGTLDSWSRSATPRRTRARSSTPRRIPPEMRRTAWTWSKDSRLIGLIPSRLFIRCGATCSKDTRERKSVTISRSFSHPTQCCTEQSKLSRDFDSVSYVGA
jgi:hypothetical protein